MRMMMVLCLALVCLACSKDKNIEAQRPTLQQINQNARTWAERRGLSMTPEADIGGSVHDAALFDGLLCFSGEQESCDAVQASQDYDGRFWRSPAWKGHVEENSFSRDMALGVLAYLLRTRDQVAARRWQIYIESVGQLCPSGQGTCGVTPLLWSVFYHVWRAIGLEPNGRMNTYRHAEDLLVFPTLPTDGFALHLIGVEVMLLQSAGQKKYHTSYLLQEKKPGNPFYQWLYGEYRKAAELTVGYCGDQPESRRDWIWQRADIIPQYSSGWDCIFMSNLLLR